MMDKQKTQWLVITDLDGTLLNHHDYTTDNALPAIKKLQDLNIPIIFNTSKTFSESITIQNQLNIKTPFIVENGSSIYLSKQLYPELKRHESIHSRDQYWEVVLGKSHSDISHILKNIDTPSSYYQLLSACSAQEASSLTGLSLAQSEQAISREFSEPLIWLSGSEELAVFKKQLEKHDLNTLQGGRFLHVLGNCDKGKATDKLIDILSSTKTQIKTITLGDSANDAAMLITADISIIVNSPSNTQLQKLITPTFHTTREAPDGWAEGISYALAEIKESS